MKPDGTRISRSFRISGVLHSLCLLGAGAVLALAFPPWSYTWLAWFGLIPWLLCIRSPSPMQAFGYAWLFGLGLYAHGMLWGITAGAAHFELVFPFNWLLALVLPCWMALFPAGAALIASPMSERQPYLSTALAVAGWGLMELLRVNLLGGVPWLELGASQVDGVMSGAIPLLGAVGAGMVVVAGNACVLEVIAPRSPQARAMTAVPVLVLVVVALAGTREWNSPRDEAMNVAMVQGGVSAHPQNQSPTAGQLQRYYIDPTISQTSGTDLVLWPETSIADWNARPEGALERLFQHLQKRGTALILGGRLKDLGGGHVYNTAFILEGGELATYRKVNLFPFVESDGLVLPDAWLPEVLRDRPDYLSGQSLAPVRVSGHSLGLGICWEGLFSRHAVTQARNGAEALVNISNEHWGFGVGGLENNALALRARASETGRPLVRSTTTGLTLVIDSQGQILKALPPQEPGVLSARVTLYEGLTPFVAMGGNGFWWLALTAFIVVAMAVGRARGSGNGI